MSERIDKYRSIAIHLFILFLTFLCFYSPKFSTVAYAAGEVSHTHIYLTVYDDTHHWLKCTVCGATKDKTAHTLVGNGGQEYKCEQGFGDDLYREICSCGYKSKPIVAIHGRGYNYANTTSLNYGSSTSKKLTDYQQITKAKFDSMSWPTYAGQSVTWEDLDGDGYGYVFCGGPIMGKASTGLIGTVEYFMGTEGDQGNTNTKGNAFPEYYALVLYATSDSTPTRDEFVTFLSNKINSSSHPTSHMLYGYDTKYKTKDKTKFTQMMECFKGYTAYATRYTHTTTQIRHPGHYNNSTNMYSYVLANCYDSNVQSFCTFDSGIATVCDLCGCVFTGNEAYTEAYRFTCSSNNIKQLADGETRTCTGHIVKGEKVDGVQVELGTIYCTYTRRGHDVYRVVKGVPVSSGTATGAGSGSSWTTNSDKSVVSNELRLSPVDENSFIKTIRTYTITFVDKNGRTRAGSCGCYAPLKDDTAPTAYQHSGHTTSNTYWKVVGNGTSTKTSTDVKIYMAFFDPDQYSKNALSIKLYDSDQKTVIKFASGDTSLPLLKSTTVNDGTIWTNQAEFSAEVNGKKDIYVQATDSTGWKSEFIPMQIMNLDAKAPEITITVTDQNTWSKSKTITVTVTDEYDGISIGESESDLQTPTSTYNSTTKKYTVTRTYTDSTNLNGSRSVVVYARDKIGNVSNKTVSYSYIDTTKPTISKLASADLFNTSNEPVGWTITVTASDSFGVIDKYAIMAKGKTPADSNFVEGSSIKIYRSGTYDIYVRDKAKNVSALKQITILPDVYFDGKPISNITQDGTALDHWYYNGKRLRF